MALSIKTEELKHKKCVLVSLVGRLVFLWSKMGVAGPARVYEWFTAMQAL